MTEIYIDPNLTPKAIPTGWPKYLTVLNQYEKDLAQAKSDSVPLIGDQALTDLINFTSQGIPDSFIELDIDLEFVKQRRAISSSTVNPAWIDDDITSWGMNGFEYSATPRLFEYRTIARLKSKPVECPVNIPGGVSNIHLAHHADKVETLSPEVMKQIENDAADKTFYSDEYNGYVAGAKDQHPIAFDAGKKAGWNEALLTVAEYLKYNGWHEVSTIFPIFSQLDNLKK